MRAVGRRRVAGATLAAALVVVLISAGTAGAYIYWTSNAKTGEIGSALETGHDVNCCVIPTDDGANGLAAFGSYVYWSNENGIIERARYEDGSDHDDAFIYANYPPGEAGAYGLTVGGPYIWWTSPDSQSIGRARIDGSEATEKFLSGVGVTSGIGFDWSSTGRVYWTTGNGIGRADYNGNNFEPNFITGLDAPLAVTADAEHVYWADRYQYYPEGVTGNYTIGRANLDGTGIDRTFITGLLNLPHGLAVDETSVYWTASDDDDIGHAPLTGGLATFEGLVDEGWFGVSGHPESIAVEQSYGAERLGSGLECDGEQVTVVGTNEGDELKGTPGEDVIWAGGGDDVVRALKGDDVVCGKAGDDELWAHRGDDELHGGAGADELRAKAGDDRLIGGAHDDVLYGGAGHDSHGGGSGHDSCNDESATEAAGDGCEVR